MLNFEVFKEDKEYDSFKVKGSFSLKAETLEELELKLDPFIEKLASRIRTEIHEDIKRERNWEEFKRKFKSYCLKGSRHASSYYPDWGEE